ncbi:ABC transporter ATP-binding protein [Jatrophihabitans sp. YIM 134969]
MRAVDPSGAVPAGAPAGPSAETDSAPAVEIRGLVKRYDDVTAVDGLDLTVRRGRLLALLGPNGAGKTTTVEICEGYRTADSGSVRVLGLDPATEARALKPAVGVMPQDGVGAYTGARVGELVRLFASYAAHPLPWRPLLERVGLAGAERTVTKRLSGGQKQRLSLALAVVGRPELLFLDEPTAGMDPGARRDAWELVADLRAAGVTIVLTTHLLDEAERLADDVVVVDHGRVVAAGTPAELTRAGAEGQVSFRATPGLRLDALVTALPAGSAATEESTGRYVVRGEVDPQLLATVTAWCAAEGVMAEGLAVERRSLEDVYFELTGRVAS